MISGSDYGIRVHSSLVSRLHSAAFFVLQATKAGVERSGNEAESKYASRLVVA